MKRWFPVALIIALIAGLIGWRISKKQGEAAAQTKQQSARKGAAAIVQAATATRRDIVRTYDTVGSVESPTVVNLTPQVTGRLLALTVNEGDAVQAGQVLARLDTTEVDATVRNKEAAVAEAEQRLAQAQVTQSATAVGVGADIRTKQAGLVSAQATQAQAQADQAAQVAAAQSAVIQAQGQIDAAKAQIGNTEAAINSAKSNLANAQTNLERQQTLYKEGATAKANVDNAQTQAEVAQAAVEQAQKQRENAVAALSSQVAAKAASQSQVAIVRNKARTDIAAAQAVARQAAASLSASQANTANISAYQRNLNALNAAVQAAAADLRAAQAQRAYTTILSPITGVITQRNLDPGGLATTGQSLLTIQAIRQVWVSAGIPEEISRRVYVGQEAVCTFDALPGQTFHGRITQLNPAADAQSRQFQIRVRLDNPGYRIKPGMFGQIVLETERVKNALVVPREAVQFAAGDRNAGSDTSGSGGTQTTTTVTLIGPDSKAKIQPVQTGASDSKYIAITSGLDDGAKVVILAGRAVRDGQAIKIGDAKGGGGKGKRSAGATAPAGVIGAAGAAGATEGTPTR